VRRRRRWWWRGAAAGLDVDVHYDIAHDDHGHKRDDVVDYDDGRRGCVVHGCLRVG
jgi:hypothetical protein